MALLANKITMFYEKYLGKAELLRKMESEEVRMIMITRVKKVSDNSDRICFQSNKCPRTEGSKG